MTDERENSTGFLINPRKKKKISAGVKASKSKASVLPVDLQALVHAQAANLQLETSPDTKDTARHQDSLEGECILLDEQLKDEEDDVFQTSTVTTKRRRGSDRGSTKKKQAAAKRCKVDASKCDSSRPQVNTDSNSPKVPDEQSRQVLKSDHATPLPTTDLPAPFKRLQSIFQGIITLHSFLMAHQRDLNLTFPTLSSGLKSMFNIELTLEDLVCIRVLVPNMIQLDRVLKSSLVDASELELVAAGGGGEKIRDRFGNAEKTDDGYVLLIEFIDVKPLKLAHPKPAVDKKGKRFTSGVQSLVKQVSQTSSRSSKVVNKIMEDRRKAFSQALERFYLSALAEGADPWMKLCELAGSAIPSVPFQHFDTLQSQSVTALPRNSSLPEGCLVTTLENLRYQSFYRDQIPEAGWKLVPPRSATYGSLTHPLSPQLQQALLDSSGITNLYTHQSKALNDIQDGKHVIVSTSTSSGKSLIYQLPMLQALETDPEARAFYIFPTKALAQDQKRSLINLLAHCPSLNDVVVETFDGDTNWAGGERDRVRQQARVVFTNPDMLHVSVLPGHGKWKMFLMKLKFVIVDELHYYTGRFGAHCAMVMRRLRRLCALYGNTDVQFISCSATIANPIEVRRMCELMLKELVDSLKTASRFDLSMKIMGYRGGYTPEDRREIERRMFTGDLLGIVATNALELGVDIGSLDAVVHLGFPMSFASYRQQSGRAGRREKDSVSILVADGDDVQDQYFMKNPAALLEADQFESIKLDIMHPVVLEAHLQCAAAEQAIPLDEIGTVFGNLPDLSERSEDVDVDEVFSSSQVTTLPARVLKKRQSPTMNLESTLVNDTVTPIMSPSSACLDLVPPAHITTSDTLLQIAATHLLYDPKYKLFLPSLHYQNKPAAHYLLRNIEDHDAFRVIDVTTMKVVEEIEEMRVPFTLYEGAIFIHQGSSYVVFDLNMEKRYAKVRPTQVPYITAVRDFTNVDPVKTLRTVPLRLELPSSVPSQTHLQNAYVVHWGSMKASTTCFGYFKLDPRSKVILESVVHGGMGNGHDVKEAALVREAQGMWVDVGMELVKKVEGCVGGKGNVEYAIHTAQHALLGVWPCYSSRTSSGNLGGASTAASDSDIKTEGGGGRRQSDSSVRVLKQRDVKTECKYPDAKRHRPARIVLFEILKKPANSKMIWGAPPSSNSSYMSGQIYSHLFQVPFLFEKALQNMERCGCEGGCVGCLFKVACKDSKCYEAFDKMGAIVLMRGLMGLES
ncbi:hypothetical protein HDV05_002541 [Chytridiales sp. JEL 0842]|nr:hypothetical protein HDV05_002541 [Chytridiales sp. JEL 0842]